LRRLRSTVRQLVFGPHENYLKALNYMVVACQYSGDALNGLAPGESGTIHEPGRSMWVFSFTDHEPAVLLTYRTRDVAAEFRQSVGESVRSAFGPRSFGETLGDAIDAVDTADAVLFDSAEQAQMTTWRKGRIVLVGDSAWCTTLYAGIGVSCRFGRRRPARHDARAPSRRYPIALRHWEERCDPISTTIR
jgi:2-polyprenyl-6-methoxyphenol hydroxylase-like FAD-dependent oxidoreductase